MDSSQACTIVFFTVFLTACLGQECEPRDQSATCPDRPCSDDRTCARAAKTCECVPNCGWSCVPVGCRSLDSPENGFVTYDEEIRSVGTTATFSCSYGYALSGNVQLGCLESKEWNATNDASCDCPQRDEEQLQGRVCMRTCTDDTDCLNNRECLCDDICGLSCIRTALQDYCNATAIRREGVDVVLDSDTAVFGSVATITCSPGYVPLSGENGLQLHCLGNREWSGGSLVCIPEDACRDPPEFENAELADGNKQYYADGSSARYQCSAGYALSRGSIIICTDGTWSNIDIRCRAKSCGHPQEEIDNGRIVGTVFTFPNTITYVCDAGFKLSGSSMRHCQANQQWTGRTPTCIPVRCQDIPTPANGQKVQTGSGFGDRITFSCDEGFSLIGESVLTCQDDETWSASAPTCTRYCPPPPPDEGILWTFNVGCQGEADQPNGCGLSYTCEGDFVPVYKGIIWSCERGEWNQTKQPICREASCNSTNLPLVSLVLERTKIGEVQLIPDEDEGKSSSMTAHDDDSTQVYDNGHILTVKCPDEYEIFQLIKILTCEDGVWTAFPRMPFCIQG